MIKACLRLFILTIFLSAGVINLQANEQLAPAGLSEITGQYSLYNKIEDLNYRIMKMLHDKIDEPYLHDFLSTLNEIEHQKSQYIKSKLTNISLIPELLIIMLDTNVSLPEGKGYRQKLIQKLILFIKYVKNDNVPHEFRKLMENLNLWGNNNDKRDYYSFAKHLIDDFRRTDDDTQSSL